MISQVFAGAVFVFLNAFKTFKIKNKDMNQNLPDGTDVNKFRWIPRRQLDFLDKLQFEFQNFVFFGSCIFHSLSVMTHLFKTFKLTNKDFTIETYTK